jgi:hypothetical protein
MITIQRNWAKADYAPIYELNVGEVFKFATDVDYETINYRLQQYKPDDFTNDFDAVYCPAGSPQFGEFGCNTMCVTVNQPSTA